MTNNVSVFFGKICVQPDYSELRARYHTVLEIMDASEETKAAAMQIVDIQELVNETTVLQVIGAFMLTLPESVQQELAVARKGVHRMQKAAIEQYFVELMQKSEDKRQTAYDFLEFQNGK